jgi:hypothetical protein
MATTAIFDFPKRRLRPFAYSMPFGQCLTKIRATISSLSEARATFDFQDGSCRHLEFSNPVLLTHFLHKVVYKHFLTKIQDDKSITFLVGGDYFIKMAAATILHF